MEIQDPQTRDESHIEASDKRLFLRSKGSFRIAIASKGSSSDGLSSMCSKRACFFCPESSTEWLLATLLSNPAAKCSTVLACGLPSMLMTMVVLLLRENEEMVAVPQQLIPQPTSILIDTMPYPLLRTKAPWEPLSDDHPAHTSIPSYLPGAGANAGPGRHSWRVATKASRQDRWWGRRGRRQECDSIGFPST